MGRLLDGSILANAVGVGPMATMITGGDGSCCGDGSLWGMMARLGLVRDAI